MRASIASGALKIVADCGMPAKGETSAMSTSELKLTFDAVYYHVRDVEKSIAFYRDILGFHLTSRDYVARFDLGGVLFELVPNPPNNALPGTGNARVSLGVKDIRQAIRELKARGVATTPVKDEPGGLLSYFKDPDGNELCLWQYV
jgi:catechol 2,3-dioxygenase-like lactoylglutathione lyase family enzyme